MSLLRFIGIGKARDFSQGQIWAYQTRPGEEASTVLINKVEVDEKLGRIFHISVRGVKVKNPHLEGVGVTSELPHFPVSRETLEKSLTKFINTSAPSPEYIEGYKEWKRAFDLGEAGIFSISVAEIVNVIETTLSK